MEKIEQVKEEFDSKKPKKKGCIIACVIAAIVVIALVLIYFLYFSKPQRVFDAAIDKLFNVKLEKIDSLKFNTTVKASIESDYIYDQEIIDQLSKSKLKFGAQIDSKEKKSIFDLGLEYDNQSVVDAQVYYNDGELYTYLNELFDKYIEIEIEDEYKEQVESIFESINNSNMENYEKANKIIGKELKKGLKEYGEFDKEKATINIGGKEQKVTNSTVKLSGKNMYKFLSSIASNLSKNEKFLECFEVSPKDKLKEIAEALKNEQVDEKSSLKISIYTKGLTNEFKGMEVEVNIQEENQTLVATLLKVDDNKYSYNIAIKEGKTKAEVIKCEIKIDKDKKSGKYTLNIEVPEVGKAEIVVDYTIEINNGIDNINTNNKIKMNEMTEEDIQGIMEKLQKRPLIGEYLKSYMGSNYDQNIETSDLDKEILNLNVED